MLWGLIRVLGMTGGLRLVGRLMLDGRVPLRLKLIIPAAVIYFISPIDLIPDFLPLRGRIDDILVALLALGLFVGMAPRDVVLEHIRGRTRGSPEGAGAGPDRSKVIEGSYRVEGEDQAKRE